ncbi:unnamed protein product [Meganyctiphanes norvegica]|uniref:Alpha-tubulin N-acetyltransferase n=1 Tax=Meganyctiphanes norvegica TaxID=48144 RepID=A0AAV2QH18_MEGNR
MEFKFDVGYLLPQEITRVDKSMIMSGWQSTTRNRVEFQQLYQVINLIGEASSFAQGLNNVITNAEKLQSSDHLLYLMKEEDGDRSLVVGMLKIGRKKLFLLDPHNRTKEVAPLCVLDFYIHESRQRRGYGRRLFEYMLKDQNVHPGHMAVDKPSDKFLGFLRKHYGLTEQVPQINNFVVYDIFFGDRPVHEEEWRMTEVIRGSPRAASPERRSGNHSPSDSRRSSSSHFAGLATQRANTSMADILHGRMDRHTPSARLSPRYQTTLDWMRGDSSEIGSPYSRTPNSRTPNSFSPCRTPSQITTPRNTSPPHYSNASTPPRGTSVSTSRKDSFDMLDGDRNMEGSVGPTPATSPQRSPNGLVVHKQPTTEEEDELQEAEEINEMMEKVSVNTSLHGSPIKEASGMCGLVNICKANTWRDSISRNSEPLVESMSSRKGSTMAGVLEDGDSVAGHLKFHHHALW